MRTSEKIIERVAELEVFFKENAYAMPNEPVLKKVKFLCTSLCIGDSYVSEKAEEIAGLSVIFFSDRKHNNYPGGADELYNKIAIDLIGRIKTRAKSIEFNENAL
jgi:hypothetical protein